MAALPQPQKGQPGHSSGVVAQIQIAHTGPLPHPQIIEGYEKVLPGAADRILKLAEREQLHRHGKENREQWLRGSLILVGQIFALITTLTGIAGGVFLAYSGKPLTGFSVFFTSLAVLGGIYLFNKRRPSIPPK